MKNIIILLVVIIIIGVGSYAAASPMRPIISPERPDIKHLPKNIDCSSHKYALLTFAIKTVPHDMGSQGVAKIVAPKNMPVKDIRLLGDQIAVINFGKKEQGLFVTGTKLKVPVYEIRDNKLPRADLRNWHHAVYAGLRWGVSPALLVAVRNHENHSSHRDGFALGVMHVKWEGMWLQYEQGAYVIKALIANRQKWDPWKPTYNNIFSCGRSYAEGSRTWGPQVWSLYKMAIGK